MSVERLRAWVGETASVERTVALGRALGALAREGDVLALVGELGAGKTQLVRGVAAALGVPPAAVSSPTFVLIHEYPAAPATGSGVAAGEGLVLVHIDAYRLDKVGDLESVGWEGTGEEMRRGAVVVVEWADRLGDHLGPDALEVSLAHAGEGGRRVRVCARGAWARRRDALATALAPFGFRPETASPHDAGA